MGKALQVVSGRVTNPGATITALTVNTGDSFTVRSFPFGSTAYIDEVWAQGATAGVVRVRSPRLHDVSQAIRERFIAAAPRPLLPEVLRQPLYPQDLLTFEMSGGGAETDLAAMLLYYDDLPGIAARLYTWPEVQARIVNVAGMEQAFTTSATAGDYGGSQALNADFDTFKRNVDYAILGYLTDTSVGIIGITGPDTGNLRVGGPGTTESIVTREWFVDIARDTGEAYIPVINAANVGATNIDAAHTTASVAINVTVIMAELSGQAGASLL